MSRNLPEAARQALNANLVAAVRGVELEHELEERDLALAALIGAAVGQLAATAGKAPTIALLDGQIDMVIGFPDDVGAVER